MKISVVIATFNRVDSLMQTLSALAHQQYPADQFEVIVVNDGSSDGTVETVMRFREHALFRLTLLSQKNKGPAAARNKGIKFAAGEIIAFTDDDCIPDADWISSICSYMDSHAVVGVQGRTYTDLDLVTPFTHQIHNVTGSVDVPTCNAAYRRSLLNLIGGFDENFPYPHNEDADLAWRASKVGGIAFSDTISVHHPPRKDSFMRIARRMRMMESEFRLFHKDPESYRWNRSSSSWMNIYWEVGVKTQLYYLKSRFRYIDRPVVMLQGLMLTLIWWGDLLLSVPKFIRADRRNKLIFGKG